jgi:hypothetical protein
MCFSREEVPRVLNDRLALRRLKNMRRVPTSIPGVRTENEVVGLMDEE